MSLKCNYHTHNQLCNHAIGNCEDYVKEAIKLGMEEIGLSDHNPVPKSFMSKEDYLNNWIQRNMTTEEFTNIYLKELEDVINKYGNQIKILKGLECEYIPKQEPYYHKLKESLDYLLVGMHFFEDNHGNIINSYSEINYENVIDYAKACVEAMKTGLFSILVHPDLFMFDYKNINGERKFDENAIIAAKMIIEAANRYDVALEVNANGLNNSIKYGSADNWLYPYKDFWEIVKADYPSTKIVIGADAHNPKDLDSEAITQVESFCERLGLRVLEKLNIK